MECSGEVNTAGSALPKDEILHGKQHHLFSAFPQQDGSLATLSFDPVLSDQAQSINSLQLQMSKMFQTVYSVPESIIIRG